MTKDEALDLALKVMQINLTLLKKINPYKGQEDLLSDSLDLTHKAITAIKQALSAPTVQEWMKPHPKCDQGCLFQCTKGFTQFPECATPPAAQQEPVPLTDEQIAAIRFSIPTKAVTQRDFELARAIEAAHGITEKGQP